MNDALAWFDQFLNGLRGNRVLMVLVFCWVLGFYLKKSKWFTDNKLIPMFVVPIGAGFSMMIDNHHTPDLALWQERIVNYVVGFIISTGAWVSHRFIWKNLSRLPVVGQYLDTGNSDPRAFVKGQNADEEDLGLPAQADQSKVTSEDKPPTKGKT